MELSQKDLVQIVDRSSTITERLGVGFLPDETQLDQRLSNSRLEKWCQVVAQGNQETFAKRLAWDGLDVNTICRALGSVRLSYNQPLPSWAKTLKTVMQAANEISASELKGLDLEEYRYLDPKEPIPFEEIYLPFITVAQKKLIFLADSCYSLLSEEAHAILERCLLRRLSEVGAQTLELEFSIFRAINQSHLTRRLTQALSIPSREKYQAFIKQMLTGGLLAFFKEYSVLARLMSTATNLWVEAQADFLRSLKSNWSAIEQTFQENINTSLQQVVAIKPSMSDVHNGGRTVAALTFKCGLKLIYKPKDLGIEVAFFQLLDWLNEKGKKTSNNSLAQNYVIKILNYPTHGWVEYVTHFPCENEAQARLYHKRAGMLLCLIYTLGGTDLHLENLIASGEYPVLIDLETLTHPKVRDNGVNRVQEVAGAKFLATQQFENSVLLSGLLPRWYVQPDGGGAYDLSGLGSVDEPDIPAPILKWQHTNTDEMTVGYESGQMPPRTNAPSLGDVKLSLENYLEDFVDGFQQMYQFLMNQQEAIFAIDGPLAAFVHQPVRFVFRPTRVYVSVLVKSLEPQYLREGCDRSIELDILSRALLPSNLKHPFWSLLSAEQGALEQLDIPRFTACSDSDSFVVPSKKGYAIAPHQIIEHCFEQSGYSQVISRLQNFSNKDLAQQVSLIRGAIYARSTVNLHSDSQSNVVNLNLDMSAPLTPESIVKEAVAIAQELQERAIYSPDGSVTWIGLSYLPKAQRIQFQPIGYYLYDGISGIVLFLAALEKVTGGVGFRNLALAALQSLRRELRKTHEEKLPQYIDIGAAVGCSSIIYALVKINQLLNEPELLEEAKQLASLISPEYIALDQTFDVMSGTAGAILGLLVLFEVSAQQEFLAQAINCGRHLLDHRVASNSGHRTWKTLNEALLTGFSHGAAGIAYALLRLYKVTGDSAFLDAAVEAHAYERSVYISEVGNWPDLRTPQMTNKFICMCAWCHGAPGIGLSRVGVLDILDTSEIRQDVKEAVNTTIQYTLSNLDHLCCGNLGRVEFLFTTARRLPQPQLLKTAREQAAQVITRAQQRGGFSYGSVRVYNPGFFQGVSGIGYELLRLAYPSILPSVLLWE
ncbi:type 2 lanthipeptide synthetase LanM family protein [Microcystis aeruginosa CS-1036]|uniref:type 2 lanthipeptide synthetase LanM family protein n=1 Tax=Microcystis TaxID=1125 RepID=UPI00232CE32A|nr:MULTISPECIES: type 2 lanthipeptide synthetase LanM family protein [Microcystis]MDB9405990.1 type 2 lanthipeptide synthetase LanM family protein [Microcystis sp. CS-574]MDB9544953.1 type 2 lanthipeptide synthetase LanM family protein [Microcystis aeruginosa CS-1036]